jgi:hypothetical protein
MIRYLLIATILLSTVTSLAQNRSETKFGLRLGANYSELESDFFEDATSRIAPSVTFFAEIPLGTTFALVPEISFDGLGVKEDAFEPEEGNPYEFKANYLSGGLLGQVNITRFLYLNAGAKLAINISENDDNDYYDGDLLGVGGLGFKLSQNFSIDARYGYGFTNVFEGTLANQGFEAENRFYQLTLSYRM